MGVGRCRLFEDQLAAADDVDLAELVVAGLVDDTFAVDHEIGLLPRRVAAAEADRLRCQRARRAGIGAGRAKECERQQKAE